MNYDLIKDNIYWIDKLNYNQIYSILKHIPPSIHLKYTNISKIIANRQINNQIEFVYFIRFNNCLTELILKETKLDQQFFDLLPFTTTLTKLSI